MNVDSFRSPHGLLLLIVLRSPLLLLAILVFIFISIPFVFILVFTRVLVFLHLVASVVSADSREITRR